MDTVNEDVNTAARVVILLENLPVQRDRRVWRQAQALVAAGMAVTIICPSSSARQPRVHTVDGVEIRSFRPTVERAGVIGFVWEYAVAFIQMARLLGQTFDDGPIAGVQACNPPDIFFPLAWWARRRRIPFVFDQHDLTPELFITRFGDNRRQAVGALPRLILAVLRRCERETYLSATRVIATNESYRRVAIKRGGLAPEDVTVVRNGPDPELMAADPHTEPWIEGRRLVVWMGNIGPQDGVDDAVRAVAHLVHGLGRVDTDFVFIGKGDALDEARLLADQLDLGHYVTFTGWIPDEEAFDWMSRAHVGLSADPPGPLNDKSTMNKTLEYMSFGLPVVAHDLTETRVSAGPAAVYAPEGTPESLAESLDQLLDAEDQMRVMGETGRRRIVNGLSWPHQSMAYVNLWRSLVPATGGPERTSVNGRVNGRQEVGV